MKNPIAKLNKLFESRIRLGIMSILSVNDHASFNAMKELMGLTDGNLAAHLRVLEESGFIHSNKQFISRKPSTYYMITSMGRRQFKNHLKALEQLSDKTNRIEI
jgi:DNA-binding HxlR family transcriptional regulator